MLHPPTGHMLHALNIVQLLHALQCRSDCVIASDGQVPLQVGTAAGARVLLAAVLPLLQVWHQ